MSGVLRRFSDPAWSFLVLGSFSAVVLLFVTPPFQVPDEGAHFFRSYQVSEGRLIGVRQGQRAGAMIPASLLATKSAWEQKIPFHPEVKLDLARARPTFAMPLAPEQRVFKALPNQMAYAPIPNLPQALGIGLGRVLGAPPIALFYLGRLTNALVALLVSWFAIRLLPFGKWVAFALLLSPMLCFIRSSLSLDALTYSLAFANLSVSLAVASSSQPPGRRLKVAYVASAILLFLSKHAYFSVPLALLIGFGKPALRAPVVRMLLAAYLGGGVLVGIWLAIVQHVLAPAPPGSDPLAQLLGILSEPLGYAGMVLGHFAASWPKYAAGLVGALGWLDTPLPVWFVATYWIVLLTVTLCANEAQELEPRARIVLLAAAGLGYVIVVSLIYLAMPLSAQGLRGVQARYLIPLLALVFFAMLGLRPVPALAARTPALCSGLALVSLAVTVVTLLRRYYLPA